MNISEQTPTVPSISTVTASSRTSFTKSVEVPGRTDFKANVQTVTGDNLGGGNYGYDDLNSGDPYGGGMYERGSTHFKNRVIPVVTHS